MPSPLTRRRFTLALGATALGGLPLAARPQPTELLKILTGFPAGGTADALARKVADKLRGSYASAALVENRPGAGGQIGILALRDSPADGSCLLVTPSSMLSIYPYTYSKLQYRLDDVQPVSLGAVFNHALAVGPAVPASVKTLKELLSWARAHPEAASCGSPGAGSMPHMILALLQRQSGAELRHIPYRGVVQGMQDMLGGQIAAFCSPVGDSLPHLKAGKLRVLAVSGTTRSAFLPEVPTLREQGFEITVREWYGFFMPGKAPAEAVQRAAAALQTVLAQPEVIAYGRQFGLEVQGSTPARLQALLAADAQEWKGLIQQIGFKADV
ncbi:MAG TPA: tripartite tricarboxylate transporter substrate-binding protein [Ideonella sp.]|nr:tripartite tricarboxylate transporter substrate-binding protein [Ideonella sp.]